MKERVQFIVNPFSGTSKKGNLPLLIARHLDQDRYEYDLVYTEYAEHGVELAKSAVQDQYDIVCAIGGDGTVNEIASSLVGSDTALAIVPGGSGNGFAGHLHISRNTTKAIKILNRARRQQVDTAVANDRFFLNVAGIGFDALVAFKTKDKTRRGLLPYIQTAVSESAAFQPMQLRIRTEHGEREGKYVAVVVANASYYGYGFSISPLSSIQDGELEVILIKNTWKMRYFLESYRFLNKSIHHSKMVESLKCREVHIDVAGEQFYHVDGEGYQLSEGLHCQVRPSSIWVMR